MTDEIENLLGRMPLREPPPSLDNRVLGRRHRRRRILYRSLAGGALTAAAAALIVGFALSGGDGDRVAQDNPPAPTQATARAKPAAPVRIERNWSTVAYEGVVVPDRRLPLRKFRRQVLEHVQWVDKSRGRRMEMTVPHDEVILIKAPID